MKWFWLCLGTSEVGNEVEFLKSFVQRISDIYRQKWFLDINVSPKLSTYSQFKSLLEPEKYLHVINSFWARKHLAKFRTSNHDLAIEKGRHAKLERHMRMCNMCNLGCVEDEYHFILICPKYEYLREKYLPWRLLEIFHHQQNLLTSCHRTMTKQ